MASHSFLSGQRDLVKVMEKKFQTPSANQSLKSSCTLYRFLIQGFLLFLILLVIHTNQLKAQTAKFKENVTRPYDE